MLRAEAGFSVAAAAEAIEKLPKKADGMRLKVRAADVRKIVTDAAAPSPEPVAKVVIRPFRQSLKKRVQAYHQSLEK